MVEKIKLLHGSPEWLAFRKTGIGASEAAAILGAGSISNVELWEEKVGLRQPRDLSNIPRVRYGSEAEKYLVALFALQYEDRYSVKVNKRVVYRKDGFQFASLDGELTDKRSGELGIYEGKTVVVDSRSTWDKWRGQIPQQYYIQVLHQMLVTGRKFVVLNAEFRWQGEDEQIRTEGQRYLITQTESVLSDMELLDELEHGFWGYVQRNERPPRILPQI